MNNFILSHRIDEGIVRGLLNFFEERRPSGFHGIIIQEGEMVVQKHIKDSWDIGVRWSDASDPRIETYLIALKEAIDLYKATYKFCDLDQAAWGLVEQFNIQNYPPGGGFKIFHYEKSAKSAMDLRRHLVFMTFLNTIDPAEGGGTEFLYQECTIPAEAGMTYIWPAEWTHTHRGQVSETREKTIVTGWLSYN